MTLVDGIRNAHQMYSKAELAHRIIIIKAFTFI